MNRTQAVMYRVVPADRQAEPNHPEVVGATVAADDGDRTRGFRNRAV
jgi:hypothetical protein